MVFNSIVFALFLPIVLTLYYGLHHRWQNRMLLVASYLFYGWWDVRFLFLIVVSTVIDFAAGLMMERGTLSVRQRLGVSAYVILGAALLVTPDWLRFDEGVGAVVAGTPLGWWTLGGTVAAVLVANALYFWSVRLGETMRRRALVCLSVASNLGILAFFKYFNFFIDSANDLLTGLGLSPLGLHMQVLLPVGISFYTFQTMSYTLDIYRRRGRAVDHFGDFALYVAYFPQLVAGPIERASHLLPLIQSPRSVTPPQIARGGFLIMFGLFKKIAVADGVAGSVDSVFATAGAVGWIDVAAATFLFAVQIYCDFSGYTDVARGCSKLFGIDLMLNFNQPYFATNPQQFWDRWHISLSTWLRDYLYIPLGGNRKGVARTYFNLMATMLLGGLWHGAAWNFVAWGGYHGVLLSVHRVLLIRHGEPPPPARGVKRLVLIACFFVLTCFGWLLFRATSFSQIADFTAAVFSFRGGMSSMISRPTLSALAGIAILMVWELAQDRTGDVLFYQRLRAPVRGLCYAVIIFLTVMGLSNAPSPFIYFQF